MTEREKYFSLLALVCEKMPYYAAQSAANAGIGAASRLQNVKVGRVICLPELVALVRHSLSDFEIPAHLLPETAEQQIVTA
jgi:hypothetical protein